MNSAPAKTVGVVGLGYVGLTTAVGFGLKGYRVIGIESDPAKVDMINRRASPIFEEGLTEAIQKVDIKATTDYAEIFGSDVTFICVGTPSDGDGTMNIDCLIRAVRQLADALKYTNRSHLIVIRCTVAPGTTERVVIPLLKDTGAGICLNPEFLREGRALEDFQNPFRIVIGERNRQDGDKVQALYNGVSCPIVRTDIRTAEMIKCASNAMLASRISLINEIGNICKQLGIDVSQVARGMGYDVRIGNRFLNAGIGFGGSCLPKDLKALIAEAKATGYEPRLLEAVFHLNEEQPLRLIQLLEKHLSIDGKTIGILGLAFKPRTDDVRETRAVSIVEALLKRGARVRAYDPQAMATFKVLFPQIEYAPPPEVLNSDAVLILTEWPEFETLDYKGKIVIDGRSIAKAREAGIYEGICW